MITVFTGNMVEEVFNVVIVLLFLFLCIGLGTRLGKNTNDTHP